MRKTTKQTKQSPRKWFDPMGVYAKEDEEIAREKSPPPGQGPTREDSRRIVEAFRPTKADLERVYTDEELRWLCLHTKFKVRMDWFNPVETFMRRWHTEGRVQRWSQRTLIQTLNKAILRNDDYMKREFSQKIFDDEREFFRRQETRCSNVCLDEWHRQREKEKSLLRLSGSDQIVINENTPEDANNKLEMNNDDEPIFDEHDDTAMSFQRLGQSKVLSEECIVISEELYSKDSNDGIISKDVSLDTLPSFHAYTGEIDTESFFNTDPGFDTQSQPQTAPNSELLTYNHFGSQIPLTSTQNPSQSQN